MKTENEHPLRLADIALLERYFHNVEAEYYSLFTLLAAPFRDTFFFDSLCGFLAAVDRGLFRIPFMRRYAWIAIIYVSNPKE